MDYFSRLAFGIKTRWKKLLLGLKTYLKRLLFPVYLFPFKLASYSVYYLVKFFIKLILAFLGLVIDCLVYPFKSLKNFLKSLFIILVALYLLASLFVIADYLRTQYGWYGKFLCSYGAKDKLVNSVVRVVGGYSEGTGFFISPNQVLTNFHVIADEPSPKIIFPDGKFVTPTKMLGNQDDDLAILFTDSKYPSKVLLLPDKITFRPDEPLISTGYPLGTSITGKATAVKGNFIDIRKSSASPDTYIQTNINLVAGMSGGPLADICGNVVGINTMGLSGLSFFITADQAKTLIPTFTDQGVTKINVDPSLSPEDAVRAYYTYLKARRMRDGFNLLSQEYLQKTNFDEWTNRFKDILDVTVFISRRFENTTDTAFVKFSTKNWVNGEVVFHYYEGTWKMVKEAGLYKIQTGKILEVDNPDPSWFYN